ncbi:MAG: hypothetical protein E7056_06720 [Lentisphaerae bacterium]|nr:hypothetical protein [Lentisphaerota bacterium]
MKLKTGLVLMLLLSCARAVLSAGEEFLLLDRSGGGMNLQGLLGTVFKQENTAWPQDLSISLKALKDFPELPVNDSWAMVSESFLDFDKEKFEQFDYALLPLIVAVPSDSPLDSVTAAELKAIFNGRINRMEKLGHAGGAIRIAGMRPDSPAGRAFRALIMQQDLSEAANGRIAAGSDILPDMILCNTPEAAKAILLALPAPIVFGSWALAEKCADSAKILKVDGVLPTKENIVSGRYKFAVKHSLLVRKGRPKAENLDRILYFLRRLTAASGDFLPLNDKKMEKNEPKSL